MEVTDDDRDEAYHSGLYSLQSEANSTELIKRKGPSPSKRVGKSPSPVPTGNRVRKPASFSTALSNRSGGQGEPSTKVLDMQGQKAQTPMTNLAGHFSGVKLSRDRHMESPTGEFDSGVFPSLPESAYGSMPSAPSSISDEHLPESSPVKSPGPSPKPRAPKELEQMDIEDNDSGVVSMSSSYKVIEPDQSTTAVRSQSTLLVSKPQLKKPGSPVPASLSVVQSRTRVRSESPCVPPVGESIEVFTDTPPMLQSLRQDGFTRSKRSAMDIGETEMWHHKKTPRLSDEISIEGSGSWKGGSKKPIRVSTIISPASSPRPRKRGGLSPHRSPRDSHSPVSISISEDRTVSMDTSSSDRVRPPPSLSPSPGSLSPSSNQQPSVNFKDIHELSQSSNPERGLMYVTLHPALQAVAKAGSSRHTPILLGVGDIARHGQEVSRDQAPVRIVPKSGVFVDSKSPKRGNSPIPPSSAAAAYAQLLAARLARSTSPGHISPAHSPRSSATSGDKSSSDKKNDGTKSSEKKEEKPGAGNALLQVTEAHLATLSDEDGDTPLHLAIIHENSGLTQYLVKLIVGVYMNLDIANNMRQTPLHLAVITRQPLMVRLLVGTGASVNFPDRKGNTALHLAAARRDVRILQLLAQATNPLPDYNAKNFSGLTAVHVATKEASIDVLKFFFQMGANKNAPDACSGRTALHYAVESENFTLVNFLLENNVNVNAVTFSGNTPLHVAAGRRLKEIVALLMAYGANPAIANGEGDFPSDLPASLLMQRAKMHNAR